MCRIWPCCPAISGHAAAAAEEGEERAALYGIAGHSPRQRGEGVCREGDAQRLKVFMLMISWILSPVAPAGRQACPFENAADIYADNAIRFGCVRSIAHEPAGYDVRVRPVYRRNPIAGGQRNHLIAMGTKKRVAADHQSAGLIGESGRESGLYFGWSACVEYD
jgi:hypothetical protein